MSIEPLYRLSGEVIPGRGAGAGLGFPTANFVLDTKSLPPFGVYLSRVITPDGALWDALTNVGVHPTVAPAELPLAETYLFAFQGDLYTKRITVELLVFLRGEKCFASLEELKDQISKDRKKALEIFKKQKEASV